MTDAEIYACWRKHDAKRFGKRLPEEGNAIDDAAEELGIPYRRVRQVIMTRLMWMVAE